MALTANATDSDGVITLVEFYNGSIKIGEAAVAPYAFTLTSAAAGDYPLTAVATDDQGAQATSNPVNLTVKPAYTTGVQTFDAMGTNTAAPAGWQVFASLFDLLLLE